MGATGRSEYRKVTCRTLDALGLNRLMRARNRYDIRVLTLHGVSTVTRGDLWEPLRPQLDVRLFDAILGKLSKSYDFVSMDRVLASITGKSEPMKNSICLTFDDGYSNNFREALPVLEKYEAPGTFYVTSGNPVTREPFWFDRLDYVLQEAARQGAELEIGGRRFDFESDKREDVSRKYVELRKFAKRQFPREQEFVDSLNDLAEKAEEMTGKALKSIFEEDHWSRIVTPDELSQYASHPLVTIGSHTVNHLRLSFASSESIASELEESKTKLEAWTGRPVLHFAYPNGDFDNRSIQAVRDAGYATAVTSDAGVNRVGQNPLSMPRLDFGYTLDSAEVATRVSGLESFLLRLFFY